MAESVKEAVGRNLILGHAARLAWLAEGHLVADEYERAWAVAHEALALTRRYKEKGQEAWTLHLLGEIAARRDPANVEAAALFYRQAMTGATELGMRPALAHSRLGLGELNAGAGKAAVAREHLTAAARLFGDIGIAAWQKRAERQLGKLST
jgi:hypothetical protein